MLASTKLRYPQLVKLAIFATFSTYLYSIYSIYCSDKDLLQSTLINTGIDGTRMNDNVRIGGIIPLSYNNNDDVSIPTIIPFNYPQLEESQTELVNGMEPPVKYYGDNGMTDLHTSSTRLKIIEESNNTLFDRAISSRSVVAANKAYSSLSNEMLQKTNLEDTGTNIISNETSSLRHKTSQQSKTSFTCYNGTQTLSFPHFPHFIIVGAQKAGTTAISTILDRVPNLLGTQLNEAHYWDYEVPLKHPEDWSMTRRCQSLQQYFEMWDTELIKSNTMLFEKTPRMLTIGLVPKLIDLFLPHKPKIIIILRDPITRLFSEHKMSWQNKGKKFRKIDKRRKKDGKKAKLPSFEDRLKVGIEHLKKKKAIRAPRPPSSSSIQTEWNSTDFGIGLPLDQFKDKLFMGIARGFYAAQIKNYMEFFSIGESIKVICYENFMKNKAAVMQELLEFVGSPPYKFDDKQFDEYLGANKILGWYPSLKNETKTYLKYLYKPFNDELADLLGESWRGVWD